MSFASSIICFISSALGAIELVLVAGLEAAVVVVAVLLEVAGLEVVAGGFGATVGLCAAAMTAVAARMVSVFNKCVGLMVAGIVLRPTPVRQASRGENRGAFLLLQQS